MNEQAIRVSIAVGDSLGVLQQKIYKWAASIYSFNRGGRFFGGAALEILNNVSAALVSIAVGDSLGVLPPLGVKHQFQEEVSIAVGDSLGVLLGCAGL